jgi:uncharacterized protein
MRSLKRVVSVLILAYLVGGGILFTLQRELMYFPTVELKHQYEIRKFAPAGETINVVVLNRGNPNAIIYYGGNGEQVVSNAANFIDIFKKHTIYLLNYRGYSGSTGVPTEQGIYSDAQYIYDEIKQSHTSISIIGRSLGSGVATFIASTRAVKKMALITPYDSIQNIAQDQYPMYPMSLLLLDKYRSSDRIKNIKASTLVIIAEFDSVIPLEHSERLLKEFSPLQVEVETIRGEGHNSVSQDSRYYNLLQGFFE